MDDEEIEVLDLTQARCNDSEPRTASTFERLHGSAKAVTLTNAQTFAASNANASSKNGDKSDAASKHSMVELTALRHRAARTTDSASIKTFQARRSDRGAHGRRSSPPAVFKRPHVLDTAAELDHNHDIEQAGFATPSGSRKRRRSTILTPPSTQASRSISWAETRAEYRRNRFLQDSMRHGDNGIEEGSPLAKKSKRVQIDDIEPNYYDLLEDGRKLDARLDDLLNQGGRMAGDTPSPSNDTATVDGGPTASRSITNEGRSDTTPRLQLSPAQRAELWSKFTEDEETGRLKFCDCEVHRGNNNGDRQADRESRSRAQSQTEDTDENLSIKTKKCQVCGGAKVKQDKRELFATQWQDIFGRSAQTPQQVGVEGWRAPAVDIGMDGIDVPRTANDPNTGSNDVGDLGVLAARDAELDRLLAINEQLRAVTLELVRKHDAELKALGARQEASDAETKRFRADLATQSRELQKHMAETFSSFADQMSTAMADEGRLADAAGSRRRTRIEDLPQNRMLETAGAFSSRYGGAYQGGE